MQRFVVELPAKDDESAYRVELMVGQTIEIDARNRYFLVGRIEAENIRGWGYSRYRVPRIGPVAGTRMAVDPRVPKVARFVTLGGEPFIVRYNSRLPLVIYVPDGAEVRYRVWTAGQTQSAKRG